MIHLLLWENFSQIIRDGMRRVVGRHLGNRQEEQLPDCSCILLIPFQNSKQHVAYKDHRNMCGKTVIRSLDVV